MDLRLRPYGSSGELVYPLEGLLDYYAGAAQEWEIQALLKIRVVTGDPALKQRVRDLLCRERTLASVRVSIIRMRAAQKKPHRDGVGYDVKNDRGGIRDIEFLAQGLQLAHASRVPSLVTGNTLIALRRLAAAALLPDGVARQLADDYVWLRRLEHYLQILADRQVHAIPTAPTAPTALARRVLGPAARAADLTDQLAAVADRVSGHFRRQLHLVADS